MFNLRQLMTQQQPLNFTDTGDPFQDAFSSGLLQPKQQAPGHPMLGGGLIGAGIGGMLGGPKYAVPAMIGGGALGALVPYLMKQFGGQ